MRKENPEMGLKILIVDDEKFMFQTWELILADEPMDFFWARNQRELRMHLTQSTFDVAIVDLRLGDIDGLTLGKEIKSTAPGTIVYLLTGLNDITVRESVGNAGLDGFFQKPMDIPVLADRLKAMRSCPP